MSNLNITRLYFKNNIIKNIGLKNINALNKINNTENGKINDINHDINQKQDIMLEDLKKIAVNETNNENIKSHEDNSLTNIQNIR